MIVWQLDLFIDTMIVKNLGISRTFSNLRIGFPADVVIPRIIDPAPSTSRFPDHIGTNSFEVRG